MLTRQRILQILFFVLDNISCNFFVSLFILGIQLNGVLDMLRHYKEDARKLLMFSLQQESADAVKDFWKFQLTAEEDNPMRRKEEETVIYNFHHFLKQVESKSLIV